VSKGHTQRLSRQELIALLVIAQGAWDPPRPGEVPNPDHPARVYDGGYRRIARAMGLVGADGKPTREHLRQVGKAVRSLVEKHGLVEVVKPGRPGHNAVLRAWTDEAMPGGPPVWPYTYDEETRERHRQFGARRLRKGVANSPTTEDSAEPSPQGGGVANSPLLGVANSPLLGVANSPPLLLKEDLLNTSASPAVADGGDSSLRVVEGGGDEPTADDEFTDGNDDRKGGTNVDDGTNTDKWDDYLADARHVVIHFDGWTDDDVAAAARFSDETSIEWMMRQARDAKGDIVAFRGLLNGGAPPRPARGWMSSPAPGWSTRGPRW
jgi:hypothetical protein